MGSFEGRLHYDIAYRRRQAFAEILVRFDLTHPWARLIAIRTVCVGNSFRSELATKRAIFDCADGFEYHASFPANERKELRDYSVDRVRGVRTKTT